VPARGVEEHGAERQAGEAHAGVGEEGAPANAGTGPWTVHEVALGAAGAVRWVVQELFCHVPAAPARGDLVIRSDATLGCGRIPHPNVAFAVCPQRRSGKAASGGATRPRRVSGFVSFTIPSQVPNESGQEDGQRLRASIAHCRPSRDAAPAGRHRGDRTSRHPRHTSPIRLSYTRRMSLCHYPVAGCRDSPSG
jgi:hypothetical protein